jgi:tetratricopeptide (TPR) repeat protein
MDLAERLGHLESRVMLLSSYGVARYYAGAIEESLTHVSEAVRLADQSGNDVLRIIARVSLSLVLAARGNLREALAILAETETLCGADPDAGAQITGFSPYGLMLAAQGLVLTLLGRLAEAAHVLEHAIALGQVRREPEMLIPAHMFSTGWCRFAGDAARALQHAHRSVELAEAAPTGSMTGVSSMALGQALLLNEQWSDAAATLESALAEMRERQVGLSFEQFILADLAQAVVVLGDFGRARALADEAVTVAQQRHIIEAPPLLARARVRRLSDGAQAASAIEADLQRAMVVIEQTEARAYTPQIHVERAELARLLGDEAAYQRELREAHRLFTEMGATGHAKRISHQLSAVSPQPEE